MLMKEESMNNEDDVFENYLFVSLSMKDDDATIHTGTCPNKQESDKMEL